MRPQASFATRACAAAIAVGLAVACSVNVDVTNKACPCGDGYVCDDARHLCVLPQDLTPQQVIPLCDPCPCTVDADCKDPARAHCSPNKVCVECSPSPDTCAVGYCNASFECTAGCKNEADCAAISPGTHCDLGRHQCVECVTGSFPCTDVTKACSPSGTCVESCSAQACAGGKACCSGLCLDTTADVLDCGACGTACSTANATPSCATSKCGWACASGFAHCNPADANTGCETNTRTDVNHCGSCTNSCTNMHANGVACAAGACTFTTCLPGFANCDGNPTNGCECACGAKGQPCCPTTPACANGFSCNGSGKCT